MTRDVLGNGTSDPDMHREVLGISTIPSRAMIDVIGLAEGKEMAHKALLS